MSASESRRSIDDYTYEYGSSGSDDDGGSGDDGGDGFVGWNHDVRQSTRALRATSDPKLDPQGGAGASGDAAGGRPGGSSSRQQLQQPQPHAQGSFRGFLSGLAGGALGGSGSGTGSDGMDRQKSENAANIGELPYGARPTGIASRSASAPVDAAAMAAAGSGAASGGRGGRMSRIAAMRAANANADFGVGGGGAGGDAAPAAAAATSRYASARPTATGGGGSARDRFNANLRDAALASTVPKPSGSRDRWGADIIDFDLPTSATAAGTSTAAAAAAAGDGTARTHHQRNSNDDVGPGSEGFGSGSGVGVRTSSARPSSTLDRDRGIRRGGHGGTTSRPTPTSSSTSREGRSGEGEARGRDIGAGSSAARGKPPPPTARSGVLDSHLDRQRQQQVSPTKPLTSVASSGSGSGSIEIKPAIGLPGSYDDVRARIASRYSSGGGAAAVPSHQQQQQPKRMSALDIARRSSGDHERGDLGGGRPARQIESKGGTMRSGEDDRRTRRTATDNAEDSAAKVTSRSSRHPGAGASNRRHDIGTTGDRSRSKTAKERDGNDDDDDSKNLFIDKPKDKRKSGPPPPSSGDDADVEYDSDADDDNDDTSFEYSLPSLPSTAMVSSARDVAPLDVPGQSIGESWSVRIRLISAVDLPPSLTPNAPLCPLLKFGVLCAKDKQWYQSTGGSTSKLMSRLNDQGIDSIPSSRTRCSSHKILTPRDNGSMEWHEEMRWDDVLVTPANSAANDLEHSGIENVVVVVELCARSILDPPPPIEGEDNGSSSNVLRKTAAGEYGLGEIEKANRAAEVARKLMNDDDNDPAAVGEKHSRGAASASAQAQPAKKKRKFAKDLRLGSLVIPLTDLPLEDATHNRDGEAVVEKWFTFNSLLGGSDGGPGVAGASAMPTPRTRRGSALGAGGARRTPSVLLEISFSRPETLDESEDEADLGDEDDEESVGAGRDANMLVGGNESFQAAEIEARNRRPKDRQSSFISSGDEMDLKKEDSKEDGPAKDPITGQIIDPRNGPLVKPGVIDFVAIVGCRDIGDQTNDDGSKGWVESTPECCILEQFPKDNEFHVSHGRNVMLADKIEWFCFPEGSRLWRGAEPPTHMDLNLKRFSASSPPTMASSIAAFDACLNCTSTFTWFVMASNSDEYGSSLAKTYGAVIRFFVPAPPGIDRTQDDYAQKMGGDDKEHSTRRQSSMHNVDSGSNQKRLWVPMGILMTSSLPIVGVMEAMLLRLCETLASKSNSISASSSSQLEKLICSDIASLCVNFSAPVPGVLHCSIPFLGGDRYHLTLPPPTGLPALPHGASVTSVCRLLGAEGLTVLLAAVLTECKILIHSADVANLAMVAEVVTALIYPFEWSLPYIPVLPNDMLEFIEAPLSYFLGVPTCNMEYIDKATLHDVVVIDCDNGFSSPDYFDGRRGMRATKLPTPLPASVSSNISKAVFRLLKAEDEVEAEYGAVVFATGRHLPRLEGESLAERDFRITVALQICSLVRGYQECLFFVSASQPVFNRDRFLRNAPALFEERRTNMQAGMPPGGDPSRSSSSLGVQTQRILSPRSKRFLSNLVNTQHFHALLERLDHDSVAFFHEVMEVFDRQVDTDNSAVSSSQRNLLAGLSSSQLEEGAKTLSAALEKMEHKISTYRVDRKADREKRERKKLEQQQRGDDNYELSDEEDIFEVLLNGYDDSDDDDLLTFDVEESNFLSSFTQYCLTPIQITPERRKSMNSAMSGMSEQPESEQEGVHALSLEYLVELEKNPWRYSSLFPLLTAKEGDEGGQAAEGAQVSQTMSRRGSMGRRGSVGAARRSSLGSVPENSKMTSNLDLDLWPMVSLKDALGERRFRAWNLAQEQKNFNPDESANLSDTNLNLDGKDNSLDLTKLLSTAASDVDADLTSSAHHAGNVPGNRSSDAKDRDAVRKCLEKAYEGSQDKRPSRFARRSSGVGSMAAPPPPSDTNAFEENGVDLIAEAEAALRNPSAQRFLVSVLSQRARLESQRRKDGGHGQGARQRQQTQSSVSRLQPSAFECLVRLAIAMLEACMEEQNYLSAYQLLTHTAGFCTVSKGADEKDGATSSAVVAATDDQTSKIVYMTARIGIHPIFADLKLWERVMANHLQDRQKDKAGGGGGARGDNNGGDGGDGSDDEADESDEYEAAVTTIYEMLGYGVPAEDLAKFATRVSEERGWFATERGQALLMLARRLSSKRDEGDHTGGTKAGDLDIMANPDQMEKLQASFSTLQIGADILSAMDEEDKAKMAWKEIAWAHPAGDAPARSAMSPSSRPNLSTGASKKGGMYNTLAQTDGDAINNSLAMMSPVGDVLEPNGLVGRAAVTSLASFGANCVATGGLDGSVFLAHTIRMKSRDNPNPFVSGVRLEWGNTGTRGIGVGSTSSAIDGEFGVGAVSCLAAARGAGYRQSRPDASRRGSDEIDDREMLSAMDGCRVVAGTTGGDLRVWSVKDVYASSIAAANADSNDAAAEALSGSVAEMRYQHSSGATSNFNQRRAGVATGDNAAAAASRLKYPLKGRALSGHRGGVTCLDVPSHIYRPDSLVSGGADGLIKLWSLRQSTGRRGLTSQAPARFGKSSGDAAPAVRGRNALGTEAIEVLTGHGGKVITVKTAWHGDRLLSGGADRTVRLWDLAGSGGKCLNTLEGHLGWVTQAHYWGPHTVVSASTDRSIALWDTRAGNHALFVLRYHLSPISDLLVGSRTEFLMVSAGADGAVATWDFRAISGVGGKDPASQAITKPQVGGGANPAKTVREPVCTMSHCQEGKGVRKSGAVLLSKGAVHERSVMSASVDSKMKEWDVVSGRLLGEQRTGHTDVVSCLSTFMESDGLIRSNEDKSSNMGGLITSSWDGTIRMKRLQLQHK